jgi:DNA mismatch repair protein MutS2
VEVSQAAIAQAEQVRTLSVQALALDKRAAKLDARRDRDEGKALAVFRERLKAQEMDLKRLISALQTNPNLRDAGEVLAQVKASRLAVTPSTSVPETPVSAVGLGDRVQVLGGVGTVVSIQGERVDVEVRGKRLRVRLGDLGEARPQGRKKQSAVQILPPVVLDDGPACVRTLSNTIDLRGMRVEETIDAIAAFLDDLILANQPSAFLLHGHGTGALKSAIREWLRTSPYGRDWHAGGPTEGGDAFTVVEL